MGKSKKGVPGILRASAARKSAAVKRSGRTVGTKKVLGKRIQKKRSRVAPVVPAPRILPPKKTLPKISVITPSFNQGKFIERTIKSVLDQKYPDLEYIVIDGGSTDETLDILRKYEKRLQWISEKDRGQSDAINKGFRMATGEIVAWLNSDDMYLPGSLAKVGRFFADHPDVRMVYGEGYIIDENDEKKQRFPFTEPKFDLWKLIYYSDYILQQSTFFRRSTFDTIALLDENLHYGLDWDLFIRIGKKFPVEYIPEYLACIREHGEAKSIIGGRKRFRELVGIMRTHGLIRYSQCYFNYAWGTYGGFLRTECDSAGVHKTLRSRLNGWIIRTLQRILALYQRRVEQGIFQDGWIGKKASLVLPNPHPGSDDQALLLEGEIHSQNVPLSIGIRINNKLIARSTRRSPGFFQIREKIPGQFAYMDCFHVAVQSSSTFIPEKLGINSDTRRLGFILKSISVTRQAETERTVKQETMIHQSQNNGRDDSGTDQAVKPMADGKGTSLIVKFAALALFIGLAFWKIDISSMFQFLDARIIFYILLCQPLAFLCALALAKRFAVLLQNPAVKFSVVFKAIVLSNGLNVILPARLSEVLKATYINEKTGISISTAVSAVILERIGDVMILIFLALTSIGTVVLKFNVLYVSFLGLVIIGILGILAVFEQTILQFIDGTRFRMISSIVKQFVSHAATSLRTRSFYLGQMYGVLSWMCSFILVSLLVYFVGSIKLGLSQIVLLFTATTVGLLIPLLPGGIGTYEVAGIYVLQKFGYSFNEALILSLVLHVSQLIFFFITSLVIASSEHVGLSALFRKIRIVIQKNELPH